MGTSKFVNYTAVTKLTLENRSLLMKLEQQRQEWMHAETNLNQLLEEKQHLLEKEQHWSQQHQIKIQGDSNSCVCMCMLACVCVCVHVGACVYV